VVNTENERVCKSWGKTIEGRSEIIFCDSYCKSYYHYKKSVEEAPRFNNQVGNQLKTNRRLLKQYNKAGKATVRVT
jgi:hypothetical protein